MDWEEITQYLHLSKDHAISIDRKLLPRYPGIGRDVSILNGNKVRICLFDWHHAACDEAEVRFYCRFANDTTLIRSLEEFCDHPFQDWKVCNSQTLPFSECISEKNLESSWIALKRDFAARQLEFPQGWTTLEIPDPYWKAIWAGELRPDAPLDEIVRWAKKQFASE